MQKRRGKSGSRSSSSNKPVWTQEHIGLVAEALTQAYQRTGFGHEAPSERAGINLVRDAFIALLVNEPEFSANRFMDATQALTDSMDYDAMVGRS